MNLYYFPELNPTTATAGSIIHLGDEEAKHAVRVMRLKTGGTVHLTDGNGYLYEAVIINDLLGDVRVRITDCKLTANPEKPQFHLVVAPTKNPDRIEWLTEKATEAGLDTLSLITCKHSERSNFNTSRLNRLAISAMKQSLRTKLPVIQGPFSFSEFLNKPFDGNKYVAWCETGQEQLLFDQLPTGQNCMVLIGPEGDFSTEEIQLAQSKGFIPVSLGHNRFRTETAALISCIAFNLKNQLL